MCAISSLCYRHANLSHSLLYLLGVDNRVTLFINTVQDDEPKG